MQLLDREYELVSFGIRLQYPFQPLKAPPMYADAVTALEERVRGTCNPAGYHPAHGFNLFRRDFAWSTVQCQPSKYTGNPQDSEIHRIGKGNLDEYIAGEQGYLQNLTPVTPLTHLFGGRKKHRNAGGHQFRSDFALVLRIGLDCKPLLAIPQIHLGLLRIFGRGIIDRSTPVQCLRRRGQGGARSVTFWLATHVSFTHVRHSFALSVPSGLLASSG